MRRTAAVALAVVVMVSSHEMVSGPMGTRPLAAVLFLLLFGALLVVVAGLEPEGQDSEE